MKQICITLFLCHFIYLSACQAQSQNQIVIPMDISSQRPIVEITINGKGPYKFIFDTGSSTNVIDEALSRELGFKVVGEDSLKTQGSSNRLVSQRVEVPNVHFPNTDVTQTVEMSVVNLRAMLPVDGVLTGAFFEGKLVTIDYPGSKLIVTEGELDKNDDAVVSTIPNPRVLNLNINVHGRSIESHLDTGSPGSFSIPYSLKDQLNLKGELIEGREIRTPVASYKPWHAELDGNIKVGNVVFEDPKIVLVEGFEYANIGYGVVRDLIITIDRKNSLIKFERAPVQIAEAEEAGDGETNAYTGWYDNKLRKIYLDDGDMYLQRGDVKLRLDSIGDNLYKMVYHTPLNNELPNVRFEKDGNGMVTGLTFIYSSGREEFAKKDR